MLNTLTVAEKLVYFDNNKPPFISDIKNVKNIQLKEGLNHPSFKHIRQPNNGDVYSVQKVDLDFYILLKVGNIINVPFSKNIEYLILDKKKKNIFLSYTNATKTTILEYFLIISEYRSKKNILKEEKKTEELNKIRNIIKRTVGPNFSVTETKINIHYPEITIKNNTINTHTIFDLIVRIPIIYKSSLGKFAFERHDQFYGQRYTFSKEEMSKRYIHSHCSMSAPEQGVFCLGGSSTSISIICENLYLTGIRDLNFEGFLYQLQAYLEWESKAGGPHMYFSELPRQELTSRSRYESRTASLYKLNLLKKVEKKFPSLLSNVVFCSKTFLVFLKALFLFCIENSYVKIRIRDNYKFSYEFTSSLIRIPNEIRLLLPCGTNIFSLNMNNTVYRLTEKEERQNFLDYKNFSPTFSPCSFKFENQKRINTKIKESNLVLEKLSEIPIYISKVALQDILRTLNFSFTYKEVSIFKENIDKELTTKKLENEELF